MHLPDQYAERSLSAFGDYLLRHRLSDNRHARYFVHWTRRFLAHAPPTPSVTADDNLQSFVEQLEREGVKDWQVQQARQAVTAWLTCRDRSASQPPVDPAPPVVPAADGSLEPT